MILLAPIVVGSNIPADPKGLAAAAADPNKFHCSSHALSLAIHSSSDHCSMLRDALQEAALLSKPCKKGSENLAF